MLIVETANADEIKGVKKESNDNKKTIQITTSSDVTAVSAGVSSLTEFESINGNKRWKRDISDNEDDSSLEITASDGSHVKHVNVNGDIVNNGNGGCLDESGYASHNKPYSLAYVDLINSNSITTYYLDTTADSDHPENGIIGICIYPSSNNDPNLKLLYDTTLWEIKLKCNKDYFGFGRKEGNDNNIILGVDTDIGTAEFENGIPDTQNILLHIYDPEECSKDGGGQNTCWRRPSQRNIPEFPTIAIPIAAVIGLCFFFQQKMRKV